MITEYKGNRWSKQFSNYTKSSAFKEPWDRKRCEGNLINIFLITLEQFFINGLWTGFGQMANFFKQNNFFEQDFCKNQTNDVTTEIILDCSERDCCLKNRACMDGVHWTLTIVHVQIHEPLSTSFVSYIIALAFHVWHIVWPLSNIQRIICDL